MSTWHGDWANRQEPVYGRDGEVVGAVVYDHQRGTYRGVGANGQSLCEYGTRMEAERWVRGSAGRQQSPVRYQQQAPARHQQQGPMTYQQAPGGYQQPDVSLEQVTGALIAGATFLGALGAVLGMDAQAEARTQAQNNQAEELRRQNELLRQQNEMLAKAIDRMGSQAPQGTSAITRRK